MTGAFAVKQTTIMPRPDFGHAFTIGTALKLPFALVAAAGCGDGFLAERQPFPDERLALPFFCKNILACPILKPPISVSCSVMAQNASTLGLACSTARCGCRWRRGMIWADFQDIAVVG